MRKNKFCSLLAIGTLLLTLTGCADKKEEEPAVSAAETAEGTEEKLDYDLSFGSLEDSDIRLLLKNDTGGTITSIKIKINRQKTYSSNLLETDLPFAQGRTALWYTSQPDSFDYDGEQRTGYITMKLLIDLSGEEKEYILYGIVPEAIDEKEDIVLCLQGNVIYLEYTSVSGKKLSTYEAQKALVENADTAEDTSEEPEDDPYTTEAAPSVNQNTSQNQNTYVPPVYTPPASSQPEQTDPGETENPGETETPGTSEEQPSEGGESSGGNTETPETPPASEPSQEPSEGGQSQSSGSETPAS